MSFNDEAIQHFIDRQDLEGLLRFFGLGDFEADIKGQSLESKRLKVEPDAKESGSSHFGGIPDLPADFQWPRRQDGRRFQPLPGSTCLRSLSGRSAIICPRRGSLRFSLISVSSPGDFNQKTEMD